MLIEDSVIQSAMRRCGNMLSGLLKSTLGGRWAVGPLSMMLLGIVLVSLPTGVASQTESYTSAEDCQIVTRLLAVSENGYIEYRGQRTGEFSWRGTLPIGKINNCIIDTDDDVALYSCQFGGDARDQLIRRMFKEVMEWLGACLSATGDKWYYSESQRQRRKYTHHYFKFDRPSTKTRITVTFQEPNDATKTTRDVAIDILFFIR